MKRSIAVRKLLTSAALGLSGGVTLLWIPSCETVLTTFNPCSTILEFCDENDIDLLFADVPDYELDPTCTVPYLAGCSTGNIYPDSPGARPDGEP